VNVKMQVFIIVVWFWFEQYEEKQNRAGEGSKSFVVISE